jgi:hypothetical protein
MDAVTAVMFTSEELHVLDKVKPFIGIGAKSDEQREEWERRWNGVCQRRELIQYEAIERAIGYAVDTLADCVAESTVEHWQETWRAEVKARTGKTPNNATFPLQMAEYLSQIRASMVPDLEAAIGLLSKAAAVATPKPDDEKYEGL